MPLPSVCDLSDDEGPAIDLIPNVCHLSDDEREDQKEPAPKFQKGAETNSCTVPAPPLDCLQQRPIGRNAPEPKLRSASSKILQSHCKCCRRSPNQQKPSCFRQFSIAQTSQLVQLRHEIHSLHKADSDRKVFWHLPIRNL